MNLTKEEWDELVRIVKKMELEAAHCMIHPPPVEVSKLSNFIRRLQRR